MTCRRIARLITDGSRRERLMARKSLRGILPIVVLLALALGLEKSEAVICEDCYEDSDGICDRWGQNCVDDAQCCVRGAAFCQSLATDGEWRLVKRNSSWCNEVWVPNVGYHCSAQDNSCAACSCSGGGGVGDPGGGGGDSCAIRPGEWCPPSCTSCTIIFF